VVSLDDEEEDDDNDDGYFSPPMSQGMQTKTADPKCYDGYDQEDEEDGPSNQLLTEYHASFAKDEDKSFVHVGISATRRAYSACLLGVPSLVSRRQGSQQQSTRNMVI